MGLAQRSCWRSYVGGNPFTLAFQSWDREIPFLNDGDAVAPAVACLSC